MKIDESSFNYWCKKMLKEDNTPFNRKLIRDALTILTPKELQAFDRHRIQGLTAKEIAEELKVSLRCIYSRLSTADVKLKHYFERKNPYLSKFFE